LMPGSGSGHTRIQRPCDEALRSLLEAPDHPGLHVEPILASRVHREARINRSDRLVVRALGANAHIIDAAEHDDTEW